MNIRVIVILSTIGTFAHCTNETRECGELRYSYNDNIQNIFETSCNNGDCHVGLNGGWEVLPDFSTYQKLSIYLENGTIESRINSSDTLLSMPPLFIEDRQISDSDLAALNAWICEGFPE